MKKGAHIIIGLRGCVGPRGEAASHVPRFFPGPERPRVRVHSLSGGPVMPSITALLHTENDALRLGRTLETLYPCDDVIVVDHGSRAGTVRPACQDGAREVSASRGHSPAE